MRIGTLWRAATARLEPGRRTVVLHHGQVTDVALDHERHGVLQRLVGADRQHGGGHDLAHRRGGGWRRSGLGTFEPRAQLQDVLPRQHGLTAELATQFRDVVRDVSELLEDAILELQLFQGGRHSALDLL